MSIEKHEELHCHLVENMKPALGCSDPCVIAYCASLATSALGEEVVSIEVNLSAGLIKNASKVSIPNAGGHGVDYAAALGVYLTPEKKLRIFEDVNEEVIEQAKRLMMHLQLNNACDQRQLYANVIVRSSNNVATCTIEKEYLGVTQITKNNDVIYEGESECSFHKDMHTSLSDIWDYANTCEVSHLDLIKEAIACNEMLIGKNSKPIPSVCSPELSWMDDVVSAIQARMEGATQAVIMNCGSGNQGIFSTISVSLYAKANGMSEEEYLRACLLSNLTVIYIKKKFGAMSALCSGAVSACGVASGLVYLQEKSKEKSLYAIQNVLASSGGIICDGAKVSCALKLQTFLQSAYSSAWIARTHTDEFSLGGFIDEDVEKTVESFAKLGQDSVIFDQYMCDIVM